jgi:DnaJ-class molecular chaperone
MSDHPGDEPDGPQTGEVTCPTCGGSGRAKGSECRECAGTGMVRRIVGDA